MHLKNKFSVYFILIALITFGGSSDLLSQGKRSFMMYKDEQGIERSLFRQFLNRFSVTMMTGYGRTFYNHEVGDYSLLQKGDNLYFIENNGLSGAGPNSGYSQWLTDPQYTEGLYTSPNDVLLNSDTTAMEFRARGSSIPLLLSIHYNISRFRLGVGLAAEYHIFKSHYPKFDENFLHDYSPTKETMLQTRFFGTIGASVYDYWDYSFVVDAQFGKHNRGKIFNKDVIDQGFYFNLGIPIEKNLSEYFRVVLRPSYEFSNYKINLPESATPIKHKTPALYIQAGISLNFPEIPRCPIKSCHTQMKHIHFGREYRGQPLPKKQNPGYGENHPELEMYKGRKKGERNKL